MLKQATAADRACCSHVLEHHTPPALTHSLDTHGLVSVPLFPFFTERRAPVDNSRKSVPGKWERWRDWRLLISILYRIQHLALHVTCHTFTRTALRHETHTRRISTAKFISRSRAFFQSTEYGIGRLTVVLFSRGYCSITCRNVVKSEQLRDTKHIKLMKSSSVIVGS